METTRLVGAIALVFFFFGVQQLPAQQRPDISRAQGEMLSRIERAVKLYATQLAVPEHFIGYCQHELHLKTYAHPTNGYIHFGVNYNNISNQQALDHIIASREGYEMSFMILCLANVKKTLNDAR